MRLRLHRRPPAAPPALLCRWDLDKTYLRSEFDTLRQLWRTARERGEDKVEVPGVAELMKAIKAAAERRGCLLLVYFISASPPQIGQAIRDKLALDGVPYDGIAFKDQLRNLRRGKLGSLREHVGFKLVELLRGRLAAPAQARELLFGDDWESDALTYSLYADVLAGHLRSPRLKALLGRIGVDAEIAPEILALAERAAGLDAVDRILINLERRTPPAAFQRFGRRVVPTFNYFQTALVLGAGGWLEAEDVARVAGDMVARSGYTARRLENSLGDALRRGLLAPDVADALTAPLRAAGLLPLPSAARRGWLVRLRARLRARLRRRRGRATARPGPLDYDAILEHRRPGRGAAAGAGRLR
ncbi:MAG TPA: hypothetical protein VKW76_10420 [Candidatus Binatia bacterium]|nr:hypothetical protein [Candidatus Binatia bacterium]